MNRENIEIQKIDSEMGDFYRENPPCNEYYYMKIENLRILSKMHAFLVKKIPRKYSGEHYKRIHKITKTDVRILLFQTRFVPEKRIWEGLEAFDSKIRFRMKKISLPIRPLSVRELVAWSELYWPIKIAKTQLYGGIDTKKEVAYAKNTLSMECVNMLINISKSSTDFGMNTALIFNSEIEKIICVEREDNKSIVNGVNILGHATLNAINAYSAKIRDTNDISSYICTGLDLYLYREPCLMCGMAAIHSRFKRVFYIDKISQSSKGAFSAANLLHCDKRLNHQMQVYRILFINK